MILIIDNYDSFTYNLAQYLQELQATVVVKRNDKISLLELEALCPSHLIISPGPGRPEKTGIALTALKKFSKTIPTLGVCLGHQCIGQLFGAKVVRAEKLYHGKLSLVKHDGKGVFYQLANPLRCVRYHSLVLERTSVERAGLEISAWSKEDREIMGVRAKGWALEGVQFHPESIATESGKALLANFLARPFAPVATPLGK